jgi:genome maintenance exonuclease 1
MDSIDFDIKVDNYKFGKLERIDGEPRLYVTPEGAKLPSVTSVTGFTTREGIQEWRNRVGESEANRISRKASGRGTVVHNLTEKYILKDEGFDAAYKKAMPDAVDLFHKIRRTLNSNVTTIHALETSIWSNYLKVAGTVDCIGIYKGKLAVIDFKTSSKTKEERWIEHYFMQTSAYACAWYELTKEPINTLVVIVANDVDSEAQIFEKTTYPYLSKFNIAREQFYNHYGF